MTTRKNIPILTRLLTMATVAGAFAAISTPAQAGSLQFASNIDTKVAPLAFDLSQLTTTGLADFVELGFVQIFSQTYSRYFGEAMADPQPDTPTTTRPSAVDTFDEITALA